MTTAETIRLLDPSEVLYMGMRLWTGFSIRACGRLDLLALSEAFDSLRDNYVVLPTPGAGHATTEPVIHTGLRCSLDQRGTAALVDVAHREQVTLDALVSAAIVHAVARTYDVAVETIPYACAVNLRSRLVPPVAAAEGTSVRGRAVFTGPGHRVTPIDTARAMNDHRGHPVVRGKHAAVLRDSRFPRPTRGGPLGFRTRLSIRRHGRSGGRSAARADTTHQFRRTAAAASDQ